MRELEAEEAQEAIAASGPRTADRLDTRPPPPGKTSVAAQTGTPPPEKVHGLLEQEDEEEEPVGETEGPGEPAPKPALVVETKEEPLPAPAPQPQAPPPPPKPSAPGLTDAERLRLLENRFLRGEITELTYRELREKLGKK